MRFYWHESRPFERALAGVALTIGVLACLGGNWLTGVAMAFLIVARVLAVRDRVLSAHSTPHNVSVDAHDEQ